MLMKRILIEDFSDWLQRWGQRTAGIKGTDRQEVSILGQMSAVDPEFKIGTSRDLLGTAVFLCPSIPTRYVGLRSGTPAENESKEDQQTTECIKDNDNESIRSWRRIWKQVAIRSGYATPDVDPRAVELLLQAKKDNLRLEFIFDTNALVSGVGHWLSRLVGERSDFVRTAVTNFEVHSFKDRWKQDATPFSNAKNPAENKAPYTYSYRFNYLAACSFLERIPHPAPIWRTLEDLEESTISLMRLNQDGTKSPVQDTVLLRAVKRVILDQVPRLRRYFVTGDAALGRLAVQTLPQSTTLIAYVGPLDEGGEYLIPYTWMPGSDEGVARRSNLATLVSEALCVCDKVTLRLQKGQQVQICRSNPSEPQFQSSWTCIWVAEEVDIKGSGEIGWPLRDIELVPLGNRTRLVSIRSLLETLEKIYRAAKSGDVTFDISKAGLSKNAAIEVQANLQEIGILDTEPSKFGPNLERLVEAIDSKSLDAITSLMTGHKAVRTVLPFLASEKATELREIEDIGRTNVASTIHLLRFVGQAVNDEGIIRYGGASPGYADLANWVIAKSDELIAANPLHEAPISKLTRAALAERQISPVRFSQALSQLLKGEVGKHFEPTIGGTPEPALVESVISFNDDSFSIIDLSADGLLGYRSLKRKKQ
jgi:hypothetical protein